MTTGRPSPIERAVIATLAYFDLSDYPLTLIELRQWLYASPDGERLVVQRPSLGELAALLDSSSWLQERVGQDRGFIFLRGRADIIVSRLHRAEIAERKFRRARRIVRVFRHLPSIRLIAICNTLAYANSRDDSDIDFFILTRPGTIWSTRLLTTAFTAALGIRPRGHEGRDTICLSFFATDRGMDFRAIQRHPQDVYLHYWINQLIPLYDRDGAYAELFAANAWVRTHLPHHAPYRSGTRRDIDALSARQTRRSAHAGSPIEGFSRALQQRILPDHLRALANRDTRVIMNDDLLKFHDNDRREQYRQEFEQRYRALVHD